MLKYGGIPYAAIVWYIPCVSVVRYIYHAMLRYGTPAVVLVVQRQNGQAFSYFSTATLNSRTDRSTNRPTDNARRLTGRRFDWTAFDWPAFDWTGDECSDFRSWGVTVS